MRVRLSLQLQRHLLQLCTRVKVPSDVEKNVLKVIFLQQTVAHTVHRGSAGS